MPTNHLIPPKPPIDSDLWALEYLKFRTIKEEYAIENIPLSGENIKIAIVDSGFNPEYEELKERTNLKSIDLSPLLSRDDFSSFLSKPPNQKIDYLKGIEFPPVSEDRDDNHGTFIASTIAGKNGICPQSEIAIINIWDETGVKKDDLMGAAIYWAHAYEYHLINISQAGSCNPLLENAVSYCFPKLLMVCGAGNRSDGFSDYPGAFQKTFAIGGYDKHLNLYGDQGRMVDFLAPALEMRSYTTAPMNVQGTSYASALFTGMLGLFLEKWFSTSDSIMNYGTLKNLMVHAAYILPFLEGEENNSAGYGIIHPELLFKVFRPNSHTVDIEHFHRLMAG